LKTLRGNTLGFAELKHKLGISSSCNLSHHLNKLAALVEANSQGHYQLTDQGREALYAIVAIARASLYKRLVYSFLVFEMLEGERVRLRSFELSDLDEIMKHWNNMELRNLVGSADRGPVARSEEEEWIRNTWKQRQERKAFTFAIETTADNRLIGGTSLFNIDWTSRSAVVGISIYNPGYWGKGYGQESTNLIVDFAFRNLGLNRVELETFDFNKRAQKCYLKVGFKEVGRRRKARFIDGQYHNDIIMDILKDEWLAKSKKKQP